MEVLLQNTLPLKGNHEDLMWMYTEKPDIWSKFTQYVPINIKKVAEVPPTVHEVPPKVHEVPQKVHEVPPKKSEDITKIEKQDTKKNKKIDEVPKQTKNKDDEKEKKNVKNTKKILPVEFIVEMSENNTMNIDYIKQELQAFISQKEFSKAFGVKKCSEIMSGITNNKWNKSLVLFLSFLFDKRFVYLNKEVVFDTEKCCGDLIHI